MAPEELNVGSKGIEKMIISLVRGDIYEKRKVKSEKRKVKGEKQKARSKISIKKTIL